MVLGATEKIEGAIGKLKAKNRVAGGKPLEGWEDVVHPHGPELWQGWGGE